MDNRNDEINVIEASGGSNDDKKTEPNNNYVKETHDSRDNNENRIVTENKNDKRKKFFHQYLHQKNYQEALRSLLWEPYDCRNDSESWYGEGFEDDNLASGITSNVVFQTVSSLLSDSSLSSCSSYSSSLDDILTVEMVTQNGPPHLQNRYYSLNMDGGKDWRRDVRHLNPFKRKDSCDFFADGIFRNKENDNGSVREEPKFKCSSKSTQSSLNLEIMVSDLNAQYEERISTPSGRFEALNTTSEGTCARVIQYESSCCRERNRSSVREKNVLNSVNKMLVTVEGTLEPRDSNEGTQLVSPDTSLDLNENPVRTTGSNQVEPGTSGGNVSVVNCYRAVPVSVVSTVPTIKCLNTQENVSNVQIVPNVSATELKTAKFPPGPIKRLPVRGPGMPPISSSSRARGRTSREGSRSQNRSSAGNDQNFVGRVVTKTDRERPKSANVSSGEICCEQSGPTSGLCENGAATGSRNGSSVLSNHNRSVSNPVLGNQTKPTPNRSGSHQNIPVRLETHFGPEEMDPLQTTACARNSSNGESQPPLGQEAPTDQSEGVLPNANASKTNSRTFTSTEAQTDDVPLGIHPQSVNNREQRRRERRERRHQRRIHQSVLNSGSVWQSNMDVIQRDRRGLPDILNSHMPPPYSAVPVPAMSALPPPPLHVPPQIPVPPGPQTVPHLVDSPPGQPLPHQNGVRFLFPFPGGRRSQGQMFAHEEETPKSCCGVVVTQTVSIRWFIVMISFVGICCVIVGTVLGAMKASGREHLTVSLLMIGVGIVLVTVSVVAWRLTSQDAPSCRSMLGLGGADDSGNEPNQRFIPRMPPSYGRPHHPYAAMMYPEFQYRPPPPSYQASMQEYRLRLLLLERPNETTAGLQAAMSPPPTYRSQAGSTLGLRAPAFCRSLPQSEYSHPPSYRSRTSSTRPTLDPTGEALGSVNHSRNSSLLSHVSDQNGNVSQAVVNVISVVGNTVDLHRGDTDLQIDSIKLEVDEEVPIPPLRMLLNKGKKSTSTTTTTTATTTTNLNAPNSDETKLDNVNLVTIVTVSDNNTAMPTRDHSVESDVLAHL